MDNQNEKHLGRLYLRKDFIKSTDLQERLPLLPESEFANTINIVKLHKFTEVVFNKIDYDYIYLVEENGVLERKRNEDYRSVFDYYLNGRLVVDYTSSGYDGIFDLLWFKLSEVNDFIAKYPQYVTLDAVPNLEDVSEQWKKNYPLLADIFDKAQKGLGKGEIDAKLRELEQVAGQSSPPRTHAATEKRLANTYKAWKALLPKMLEICVYLSRTPPPRTRNGQTGWSKDKIKEISKSKGYAFTDGMVDEILAALPEELKCKKSQPI